ncbi:undecaprenyldiphospho-muramoylpentapeptide beta-N-acetylglucosaminyltransferase [Candidatus Peregrinibacteria bacterium]|nr:undecaprenyldiphospho-muramoylpentapeptide beta-N-acetylglucosaminyltransferase [Candidatus Peregrinibacteria bacterium]
MRIVLTGGGTGGHIFPNIAVFEMLKASGALTRDILYVGEKSGMEEDVCLRYGVPFSGISAGKFRRYFSLKNVRDVLKFPAGFFEAKRILRDFKPDVIFSKGGYVAFPVVLAGRMLGANIIIHDSDAIPGLTTRLSAPFAHTICVAWKEAMKFFPAKKTVLTGIPIRKSILEADADEGFRITGFRKGKPVIFVSGGSLGAKRLNELVVEALPLLLPHCQVVHFTGKGKGQVSKERTIKGYKVFESLDQEYAHVLASADLCISRAGANALFEYMALSKPTMLIPLGRNASRGDQIANASILEKEGASIVFDENTLDGKALAKRILSMLKDKKRLKQMGKRANDFFCSVEKSDEWSKIFLSKTCVLILT